MNFMKKERILQLAVLSSAMTGLSAQAALLPISPNPSSPYYADFTSSELNVTYSYSGNSSSGTGTFIAETESAPTPTANNAFTANSLAAGTGAFSESGFEGYYTLNATIQNNNGVYTVTSGSVDVYGQLSDISGSTSTTLLLAANLDTGAGSIGYLSPGDPGYSKSSTQFDFLFGPPLGTSSSKILADFDFRQGGIVLTTGTLNPVVNGAIGYAGLDDPFQNESNAGQANTFVPEPVAYPLAASIMAFTGFAGFVMRRKHA